MATIHAQRGSVARSLCSMLTRNGHGHVSVEEGRDLLHHQLPVLQQGGGGGGVQVRHWGGGETGSEAMGGSGSTGTGTGEAMRG